MEQITLATLPNATAQQVFDQVARHLLTQKKASKAGDGFGCEYRNADGLKCAAGCLIGDDEYADEFDHPKDATSTSWASLIRKGCVPGTHEPLIVALQEVHDSYDTSEWRDALCEVALRFNLEFDVERHDASLLMEGKTAQAGDF